jgi:lipopolysaccharide cholinephosphotransferase
MNLSTHETFKKLQLNSKDYIHIEGEVLKQYQKVLLHMAEDIISVCEDNKIFYQLSGGSVLGAVRHKGFIPWDDDIDLNILFKDIGKLTKALKEKYGEKYFVLTCYDKEYGIVFGKIRLRGSIARGREDFGKKECGFAIDLFFIENYFDNPLLYKLHGLLCMGAGLLLSCRRFYNDREIYRKFEKENPEIKKAFETKIFIGAILSIISVRHFAIFTNWCYGLCKNKRTKCVGIPSGRGHYFGETYMRKGMLHTVRRLFEGHMWRIPKDYDDYLRKLYGSDYMTPPPEEKREKHILLELKFPDNM